MKVIDLCPFYNEVEMLKARIDLLAGHVDRHIVIEANLTHQGDPKPLYLDDTELPVERHVADIAGLGGDWEREQSQRDQLAWPLFRNSSDFVSAPVELDALVLSCDVDELVNPAALPAIVDATKRGPVRLGMRMLYYGLDWEHPGGWAHPVAFRAVDLAADGLSWMRTKGPYPVLPGCGWHVSYWGGTERRRTKVEAFAHAENREPEAWQRIATGDATGTGPNGEQLVPATDIPAALKELLG